MVTSHQTVLNVSNATGLLTFLYSHGKSYAKQIQDNVVKNYDSLIKVARRLQDEGLIDIEIVTKRRRVQYFWLTEKGMRVAEKLKEAEDLLGE